MSVARYTTGTSQINGGGAVHGSGTLWASAVTPGDWYAATVAGPFYEIVTVTDDDDIIIEPAPATTGAGQSYVIFQISPLRGSISQNNILLTAFRTQLGSILTVSGADKTFTLNKTATTDNAGIILQQGGTSLFQAGMFGNGSANTRYQVQYLVTATWTPAISVDPTTGKVGFGVAAATQILDAVATSAALALWDNAALATGKGGALLLQASNGSSARITFASLNAYVISGTAAAEVGDLVLKAMKTGTLTEGARVLGSGGLSISTGANTSVQFKPWGVDAGFNALSLNGDVTGTGMTGWAGGNTSDKNMYGNVPTSFMYSLRINNVDLYQFSATKLAVLAATASTSTTTGALTVAGGVGILGALFTAGDITINKSIPILKLQGTEASAKTLAFYENAGVFGIDWVGNTTLLALTAATGMLRLNQYGAGTLVTDSSGNITATSDGALKIHREYFTRTIRDLMHDGESICVPRTFNWRPESGMDAGIYVGFFADEYERGVPEAVGRDPRNLRTFSDRVAIAVLHNTAIDHERRIAALESRIH